MLQNFADPNLNLGGFENVSEEIELNVFNRLHRYWSGQSGKIRAGSARNWATIWATSCAKMTPEIQVTGNLF